MESNTADIMGKGEYNKDGGFSSVELCVNVTTFSTKAISRVHMACCPGREP